MPIRYTWDPKKNAANVRKHGISFDDAVKIFDGTVLEAIDDRHDYGETRIQAIGVFKDKEIFVVYAEGDDETRRLISARKAERHEREAYWKAASAS